MAKSEDKPEEATPAEQTPAPPQQSQPVPVDDSGEQAPARPQQQPVPVDDAGAVCSYANFCRVTGTPEELIVDFGLNSQPLGQAPEKLTITQRIVVNYFTAKRLLGALTMSVQRHEAAFGVLETDVQRRVQPGAFQRPGAAPQTQIGRASCRERV